MIKGLCTPWLESLVEARKSIAEVEIPIFPKPESTFKLENPLGKNPIIFIAAGTGIAPIFGFLQHLSLVKANIKVLFIYGHRYNCVEKNDFLYSDALIQMGKDNVCRLIECTSQETNSTGYSYVQDAIRGESCEIFNLIDKENATVYVCGSPAMSKNVNAALSDVWSKHSDLDQIKILEHLKSLTDSHRIKRDLW
jgi:sulfite reductase alpha subunit-like flavoprotein